MQCSQTTLLTSFNFCLDELEYLKEDQEEHGQMAPTARRTRGVEIDFTGKDDGADEEDSDEEKEQEAPIEGKGKGKAIPTIPGEGSPVKPPSTVKPVSTGSNKNA
jgi:hypothetical protein